MIAGIIEINAKTQMIIDVIALQIFGFFAKHL